MHGSKTTVTFPPEERAYQRQPDPVTALCVYATGIELPMLTTRTSFTFGRDATCDLRVDDKLVARMQARIDRLATAARQNLKVTDISRGKNDIVPDGKVAEKEFAMGAGDWFNIGKARFFAMNEEMRTVRSEISDVLGVGQHKAIDDLLIAAVSDARHVLLIGESGCFQSELALDIRYMSHRRHRQFREMAPDPTLDSETRQQLIDIASGTLMVPMFSKGMLDQRFVAAATAPELDLRFILCAASENKIAASFPAAVMQSAKVVNLPSLRDRQSELPQLLDKWFVKRRSALRFFALRPELQASLVSYHWPENLKELRQATDRLVTLSHYPTRQQAVEQSDVNDSTLRRWERRIGVSIKFPLVLKNSK